MTTPLVALLTDFGTTDTYVGVMKGVMAVRCPGVQFIDLSHAIEPQNIAQAAYLLSTAYRYFPSHTVFLAVVDPGVGTDRPALGVQSSRGFFVGPDNGVLSLALAELGPWRAVILNETNALSNTFHGRDLFAPAAAALAHGQPLETLGRPVFELTAAAPLHKQWVSESTLVGEIIHVDHFGNLITSLGPLAWNDHRRNVILDGYTLLDPKDLEVQVAGHTIRGLSATYASSAIGELLAVVGSDRQLEIAVNRGSAALTTGARIGDEVQLCTLPSGENG